ncbi:MAG: outer membrane beta-barrel domain-containing protein [Pseudobdellovibrionaceae bacterium]
MKNGQLITRVIITLTVLLFLATPAMAQVRSAQGAGKQTASKNSPKNLKNDLNRLNDNTAIQERIQFMDSSQRVRIVQNRSVDRNHRIELNAQLGLNNNADSYVQTQNTGIGLHYHFNPQWTFGFEYQKFGNKLTPEGQRQLDTAQDSQNKDPNSQAKFPSVDYPLDSKFAMISVYPIYGKLNLFDSGVAQFDLYGTLGYGQMSLRSGSASGMMAGLGAGVWLNNLFTARIEGRYLRYADLVTSENRQQNVFQLVASLGMFIW